MAKYFLVRLYKHKHLTMASDFYIKLLSTKCSNHTWILRFGKIQFEKPSDCNECNHIHWLPWSTRCIRLLLTIFTQLIAFATPNWLCFHLTLSIFTYLCQIAQVPISPKNNSNEYIDFVKKFRKCDQIQKKIQKMWSVITIDSVHPSVHPLIHPSIHPFKIHPLLDNTFFKKNNKKIGIYIIPIGVALVSATKSISIEKVKVAYFINRLLMLHFMIIKWATQLLW